MVLEDALDSMWAYRARKDAARRSVVSKYTILGFISSGTYGDVFKATSKNDGLVYAIKRFKPEKGSDGTTYTGISQSAIREIGLGREINHENVVALREVILEDKAIYLVFEYAEHDFDQLIVHHRTTLRRAIPTAMVKSLVYQLLNGLLYLHSTDILHRDLKPANLLITSAGVVKIGDLGLARLLRQPLQPLTQNDKVVVTSWYRAPELLLGARHYNKALDCWGVGCVLAELVSLRPIFAGKEIKSESRKTYPFQREQVLKILEVLGTPGVHDWPGMVHLPEYPSFYHLDVYPKELTTWCHQHNRLRSPSGIDLLNRLFEYDPDARITAEEALRHGWFAEEPEPTSNIFWSTPESHRPAPRRLSQEDAPMFAATRGNVDLPRPESEIPHSKLEANRVGPS